MTPAFTVLGSGPTVLMLHGIGGGHRAFAPQVESFANADYRAVAWDMPGYGRSAPIEPYTFKGLAQACIELIEALLANERGGHAAAPGRPQQGTAPSGGSEPHAVGERGGQIILLGHSMGGMVAQEVMVRRPDLVSQLILCGTSAAFGRKPGGEVSQEWQQSFVSQRTAPLDAGKTMAELAQVMVPQMIGPGALPEGAQLAMSCMAEVNPSTYRRALEALVSFDRGAQLSSIAVPTLLVAGEFDRNASPGSMKQMAEAIPGSQFAQLPGVGHLQNLEAPDEFDALVLDFLATRRRPH